MGRGSRKRMRAADLGAEAGAGGRFDQKINNPNRKGPNPKGLTVGPNSTRTKTTIKRLAMYDQKAVRNKKGKVLGGQFMSQESAAGKVARVQPNRRWFGNTRTVEQKDLDTFRDEMKRQIQDPYAVILRQKQLPLALLAESKYQKTQNTLLSIESYQQTFGKKSLRKRPKLSFDSIADLAKNVENRQTEYKEDTDSNKTLLAQVERDMVRDRCFEKGQSKRIWGELYKVIDSSDILVQVLDARDPIGTRSKTVEGYLREQAPHKQLIFVLNKCDLVPSWVTSRWVKSLSQDFPTLAFHASITNSFGKGSLIQLLRQYSQLHKDRQQISVGFIGYPNVGKSSIINTLAQKKVCKVAPVPGETKVWQYITLFKRIFLIDCPGVVPPSSMDTSDPQSDNDVVLKGVVRVESILDPVPHIEPLLQRMEPKFLTKIYGIESWDDHVHFLVQLGKARGKLLKGGEPDLTAVAKIVLHDWQRGKLPWFIAPPELIDPEDFERGEVEEEEVEEGDAEEEAEEEVEE